MGRNSQRDFAIYAALTVPTVTSFPSLKSLQFSADGQVGFVAKNSVFILTPDHGINFDNSSTISAFPLGAKDKEDPVLAGLGLAWFKTMIQHEKISPMRWPEYSQVWGAVSLGSIDLSLISMTISPSNMGPNGGCVYATLSSNMDVSLWAAGKNYLKGEWSKICDVTPCLLDYVNSDDEKGLNISAVLQAQIVCIDWTPQVDFHISPSPEIDGSFLVLGSRAGSLTHRNGDNPEHVQTLSVADKWITQLAFSSWQNVGPGEGYLAYGVSDGSIGLVKIIQTLRESGCDFSFTPKYAIEVAFDTEFELVIAKSGSNVSITSMKWVDIPGRSSILVSSNPGKINLWSPLSPFHWSGSRTLVLQTQKTSIDSSAFHPVSGINYVSKHDKLIITLFDGSFHVIQSFSSDPTWATSSAPTNEDQLTSEILSSVSRNVFVKTEKEGVDSGDMLRINGALGYDGDRCFMWVYESARPSDFSYKHDAKHSNMLIVAQMWKDDDDDDEILMARLREVLTSAKSAWAFSPLFLLRPFFFRLRSAAKLDHLHARFLDIIQLQDQPVTNENPDRIIIPQLKDALLDDEIKSNFRESLATHLFGWDDLLRLRMRLSLGDFAWKHSINEERQAECGVVAQGLLNAISHRVLRTIIRHLVAVTSLLTDSDVPFVSRMIVQSLLPGCPVDLSEEGRHLSALVQPLMEGRPAAAEPSVGSDVEMPSDDIVTKLNESCPACGVEVPLQDITTAVCANGHRWARCSVTTFILSTPWVRTCVGCSRKAFLPPSAGRDLPEIARGWVVEELLEAVKKCLFCNNAFVSIL